MISDSFQCHNCINSYSHFAIHTSSHHAIHYFTFEEGKPLEIAQHTHPSVDETHELKKINSQSCMIAEISVVMKRTVQVITSHCDLTIH